MQPMHRQCKDTITSESIKSKGLLLPVHASVKRKTLTRKTLNTEDGANVLKAEAHGRLG